VGQLNSDVLYAADLFKKGEPQPVRVLDTRRWTSISVPGTPGFQWLLRDINEPVSEDAGTMADTGMACLYWSPTDPDPDGRALLEYPWEPLSDDPAEAAAELTRRAASFGPKCDTVWLCLRPVARQKITSCWDDLERVLEIRRRDQEAERTRAGRSLGRRLLEWDEINGRLDRLGLPPAQPQDAGYLALIALDQITALLDKAEQHRCQ
jgi:hypothetical protein